VQPVFSKAPAGWLLVRLLELQVRAQTGDGLPEIADRPPEIAPGMGLVLPDEGRDPGLELPHGPSHPFGADGERLDPGALPAALQHPRSDRAPPLADHLVQSVFRRSRSLLRESQGGDEHHEERIRQVHPSVCFIGDPPLLQRYTQRGNRDCPP
jgi:hypothetical protein